VNDDPGTANQYAVAIAVNGSTDVVAIWQDWRSGNSDIYCSRRVSGSWSTNEQVNDDTGAARQYYPALALDASANAYAVWSDERDGEPDIYFSYRASVEHRLFLPILVKSP